jgi:hypothetical protein
MPEGQISLKGAVEPGVVAEVLQFICGRRDRVGYLRVSNQRTNGRVWCQEGAIVAAECGGERDLPAIRRILCLKSGEFAFVDTTALPERTLFDDTTTILLDSYRQIDESQSSEPEEPEPIASATIHHPAAPWAEQNLSSAPPSTPVASASHSATPAAPPRTISASAVSHAPRPSLRNYANRPSPPVRRHFPQHLAWLLLIIAGLLGAGGWYLWHPRSLGYAEAPPAPEPAVPAPATGTTGHRLSAFWHTRFASRPVPPPPPARIVWPTLRLSGIVDAPGQTASAIINGRLVIAGETVEGVQLEAVTRTGIVLRSGTHTRFVSETTIGDPQEPSAHTNASAASTNTFFLVYPTIRSWLKLKFNF